MAADFALPDIGSGLQEAEIVAWHVEVGDTVTEEQVLCEVETEKSVIEIPVPFAGVVLELAGPPGTSLMVGDRLVTIGNADEGPLGNADAPNTMPGDSPMDAPPAPRQNAASTATGRRPRAMPVVRKLAAELGVDLAGVRATGPGGRITRGDVEAAANAATAMSPADADIDPSAGGRTQRRQPMSKLRRTIGDHMASRWREVPHISGLVEADATSLLSTRKAIAGRLGKPVPIDALLVAAVIPALRATPAANAMLDGEEIVLRDYYDIGVAVGTEEGLLVPVVRDAERLGLESLIDTVEDLVERARSRRLRQGEMGDQTFTVSNMGALHGQFATQVIPRGTTGILAVGRSREQPVVRGGAIVVAPVMGVSATFDHRAVDGLEGMRFLTDVVDALEEMTLLL